MNLTVGKIPAKVIRYTIPVILTALVQLLFNAADLVVVGQFCGSASVAAVGSTTSFTHLFIELFLGFATGVGASAARTIGANDDDRLSKVVHTSVPLALISGTVMAVAGILLSKPGLRLLNTPADILDLATSYIQIYFAGIPAMLVYNFGAAVINANGDTQKPLRYLTISGIANIVMNVIFVVAFRLDVVGVALATTISQCISAGLVVFNLMKRTDASRLDLRHLCFDKDALKSIVSIGLPTGLQNSLYPIANVMFPFYAVTAVTSVLTGVLRGIGISVPPMVISIFSIFGVRMLWLFIMIGILGFNNLYVIQASFSVSWTIQALLVAVTYFYYEKKILVPMESAAET